MAAVFCGSDTTFLCLVCDAKIHATNKLVSRHHINNEFDNQNSEEAKVASWLLPTPNNAKGVDLEGSEYKSADYLFNDMNPYLDMTMISGGGDQNLETSPPPPSTLQFKRHHTGAEENRD
nr:zinc finger protein CONSTANS-LIKE 4-like [Ipomoea batatas]